MRIFFDFEFIENGDQHPIIPISIGIVREDGAEYYAEFLGVDWSKASDWVLKNVQPYLRFPEHLLSTKEQIAEEIKKFVGNNPEFWAYFADYDWVLLCQLYGKMVDLPEGWPMFCLDIKQWMYHLGIANTPVINNQQEHNALADAQWNKDVFDWLLKYMEETFK